MLIRKYVSETLIEINNFINGFRYNVLVNQMKPCYNFSVHEPQVTCNQKGNQQCWASLPHLTGFYKILRSLSIRTLIKLLLQLNVNHYQIIDIPTNNKFFNDFILSRGFESLFQIKICCGPKLKKKLLKKQRTVGHYGLLKILRR
jgi:hypothetical protein